MAEVARCRRYRLVGLRPSASNFVGEPKTTRRPKALDQASRQATDPHSQWGPGGDIAHPENFTCISFNFGKSSCNVASS